MTNTTQHGTTTANKNRDETRFQYTARTLHSTHDTRHEAIGALARYGDWQNDTVVPITTNCLVRQPTSITVGPIHLGDKHYNDRRKIATTHGVATIDHVALSRHVNGNEQETVEAWWEIECPVCRITHEIDGGTEEKRKVAIDVMLDCCGVEWQPPSDWLEECGVCGDSHRRQAECTSLSRREPFPDPETHRYDCAECEWSGDGDGLIAPSGRCPDCETTSVKAIKVATDGGQPGSQTESTTVTVKVWSGNHRDDYENLLDANPTKHEMDVVGENTYYVPHEDHVVIADDIKNHKKYAFDVETEDPVELIIETSDHYHDTIDGFENGRPVEGGLQFDADSDCEPFKVELWGCLRMRVEHAADSPGSKGGEQ